MKRKLLLALVALISFAIFTSLALSWWDASYLYRYPINTTTDAKIYSVNDTRGLGGSNQTIIWTYSGNDSYLYSNTANAGGAFAIATDSTQQLWENQSSGNGNNVKTMWQNLSAVVVWHGDDNTSFVRDSSFRGFNASLTGQSGGLFGKAAATMTVTSVATELQGNAVFAAELWMKRNTNTSSGQEGFLLSFGTAGLDDCWGMRFDTPATADKLKIGYYGETFLDTGLIYADGSWHHVVANVFGNGTMHVYIDNSANIVAPAGTPTVGSTGIYGGDICQGGSDFKGLIDEVRIYNRTLSGAEVLAHYQNGINALSNTGAEELNGNPPQYSNIVVSPASPQSYDAGYIQFNVTWAGSATDKAWIQYNFTGASTQQFASNQSNVFRFNFTSPAAGDYSYQFFANDSAGLQNSTPVYYYTINQASTTINLSFNGTQADTGMGYPSSSNSTSWKTILNGNLSLYRNGTLVNSTITANSTSDVIRLGAGDYNYTAILSHQNYTASTVQRILTINQSNSNLSLSSSAGWSISEGASTTISCTSPLSTTLKKDGVIVANPYSAILSSGFFTFACNISDSTNYTPSTASNVLNVVSGGVGCTDNSTYAYTAGIAASGSQIVLNFTDLVSQYIVRSDLNDINVSTSNITFSKNLTSGSYLLVNSTNVSSFTISFGNYYANTSLGTGQRTNATTTNFSYSQSSSFIYTINLIDEMLGTKRVPPNTNSTTLTEYCSGGSTQFNVNDSQILVAANKQLTQLEYTVKYSATEIYYRDLLVANPIENKNMYAVDANNYQVIQYLIQLQDNTMNFNNPRLHIKKLIGTQLATITERPFDAENKAIAYLINGQQYQISVTSGSQERVIGNIYADNVNLIKTVVINNIISTNATFGNISYSLVYNNQTGLITFNWLDPSGNTNLTEMWVYNYTNQSQLLFSANSSNTTSVEFNYIVPDVNSTYLTKIAVHHNVFGLNTFSLTTVLSGIAMLPFTLLPAIDAAVLRWFSGMFLLSIPLFFNAANGGFAGIVVSLLAILLAFLGWYPVSIMLLIVAFVLAILNKAPERKTES